jgi:hypothetical protein
MPHFTRVIYPAFFSANNSLLGLIQFACLDKAHYRFFGFKL